MRFVHHADWLTWDWSCLCNVELTSLLQRVASPVNCMPIDILQLFACSLTHCLNVSIPGCLSRPLGMLSCSIHPLRAQNWLHIQLVHITCWPTMYCCAALPGYVPQPGGVDLRDVYSDGLQLGWNVNTTSNITLQEVPIGINGTLAMCANMPAFQVSRQQLVSLNVHFRITSQL